MLNYIAKIFGTKSQKDIKKMLPQVGEINKVYESLSSLSNDDLRSRSEALKAGIQEALKPIDEEINQIKADIEANPDMDLNEKEALYNKIDQLKKDRDTELEKVLDSMVPEAFAIMKETARRFKENTTLEVTANHLDKTLAADREHISINGGKAIWQNSWTAAGNKITWDMLHYDVQLIGGIVLHSGKIAEMATGEGKTLVATLPAFLNGLTGLGVHIVTVNDYLARRDSEWMAPLFEFHGLTIDCIDKHSPNSDARKQAYLSDIVYGTNNEFGFDYLRDNGARDPEELVQQKHHFAMVDEVDSVLIDEARTPLIISGPVPKGNEHDFQELRPRIAKLVEAQRKLIGQLLLEAKKSIADGNEKEGGLALFRCYRGLPKHKPLIKYLSETGIRQVLQKTENFYLQDNSKMMPEADGALYFTIDEKHNSIDLTDQGIDTITGDGEDPTFFIMPDIGDEIAQLEKNEEISDEEKVSRKDAILKDYSIKAKRIHTVNQLLKAYSLFEKDTEYIVVDGKVKIVDEQTGRVMEGRRYSDGLHQAIEAKENVTVEDATQTYATITLQNYFRMYHKLAGMTGTAETEAGEFWDIYKLDVVVIPTNKPITRDDRNDKVYKTIREKFNATVEEIVSLTEAGRPVLVGTTSVEISELVSRMLTLRKIRHNVLNAKQHKKEAEIVAEAGVPGTVTIATNMAGRGTDIKLTKEAKGAGGLAIIGTERHESRRIDRQLRGRAGRQGDPGSSQFYLSLEDNLMRMFMPPRMAKTMDRLGLKEGEDISHSMVTNAIERAQRKVEENNFGIRKRLLEYDDVMNSQREVIYSRRKNALYGDRLQLDIMNMLYDLCEDLVLNAKGVENYDSLKINILSTLALDFEVSQDEFLEMNEADLTEKLYQSALESYKRKNKEIAEKSFPIIKDIQKSRGAVIKNILVPFTDGKKTIRITANLEKCVETRNAELVTAMEKMISLAIIDQLWKEHLREMDDLKQSVQSAVYEQKDPLLIYKFEAFNLFKIFIGKVNEETISFLMKAELPVSEPEQVSEARRQRRENLNEQKEESRSLLSGKPANRPPAQKMEPVKSEKVAGRNEKVSVQYADGSIKKDVKFKTVEEDIRNNKCVLIENE